MPSRVLAALARAARAGASTETLAPYARAAKAVLADVARGRTRVGTGTGTGTGTIARVLRRNKRLARAHSRKLRRRALFRLMRLRHRPERAASDRAEYARGSGVVERSVAGFSEPSRRARGGETLLVFVRLRDVARPAQPVPLRNLRDAVAVLVHGELAALAENNLVGRLAVSAPAHRAQRILHRARLHERVHELARMIPERVRERLAAVVRGGQTAAPQVLLPPLSAAPTLLVPRRLLHPLLLLLARRALGGVAGVARAKQRLGGERARDPRRASQRGVRLKKLAHDLVIRRERLP
mmetsp:Transcript_14173/g.60657  ORF Transcript_14173/g.60657 Transcript_14173/m.60657 type:complete len:297 (-) Transcript_14173:544-1434(-)